MKRLDGYEMKLVPASSGWICVLGKAGAGEMELKQKIALWKVRDHSCRGVIPAYELSELTLATGSGELANRIRERVKRIEANVSGGQGKYLTETSIMQKFIKTCKNRKCGLGREKAIQSGNDMDCSLNWTRPIFHN